MLRRVSASAHNCTVIIVGALPFYPLLGREAWRIALILICFAYHLIFRRQCLGNYLAGLRNSQPVGIMYVTFYTAGFSTILYSMWVPFDLLAVYVAAQATCLKLTGFTIPGYLTGFRPCQLASDPLSFAHVRPRSICWRPSLDRFRVPRGARHVAGNTGAGSWVQAGLDPGRRGRGAPVPA